MLNWFSTPTLQHKLVVKNVLNEVIAELPFRDFVDRDLRGNDFSHANFQGARFIGCNCRNVNFIGSDLRNATFWRCDLSSACLAYARVQGIKFEQSDLSGVDLANAFGLRQTSFRRVLISPSSTIPAIRSTGLLVIG
jgi:uncharacterized protein YjbI with pentapeptide repeats